MKDANFIELEEVDESYESSSDDNNQTMITTVQDSVIIQDENLHLGSILKQDSPGKLPSFGGKSAQDSQDDNKNALKLLLKPESNQKLFSSFKGSTAETQYLYIPVAFVIQTDIEHHDVFKEILKSLFESIHEKEMVQERCQGSKELAYAEFLTHVAFLASIPCPTFNTRFHI